MGLGPVTEIKFSDKERELLKRAVVALETIAVGIDKSNLEARIEELESKISAFPEVMDELKKFNCCGYHD